MPGTVERVDKFLSPEEKKVILRRRRDLTEASKGALDNPRSTGFQSLYNNAVELYNNCIIGMANKYHMSVEIMVIVIEAVVKEGDRR